MKQTLFLLAGIIAFIVAVGIFTKDLSQKSSSSLLLNQKEIKEVTIVDTKVFAEVADNEDERRKGLGGRESLPQDGGMLFIFPEKTSGVVFWMKEMNFAIDIIWVRDDEVVKIDKSVQPEPDVSDDNLKRYRPETEINYVLEVNAGFSDKNNLKIGDLVSLERFEK